MIYNIIRKVNFMSVNPVSKNFNKNNPINFKSKIVPNKFLKEMIDSAIYDVNSTGEPYYGRELLVPLKSFLNDGQKDVIEFSLKEGTGQKYYTPAATDIFVNKHKVMDGYVDEFLALEEDALDGDFGKKAIVEFYECVNRKPFHKKELTKQELNLIEPDILKIQKLSPENPEILNKIKDQTDVIKNKLCKNIIKELKMVKKQIFNQPKDI